MSKSVRMLLPPLILAVGVTLLILGVLRGEFIEIMSRAVIICMECIGIG